MYLEASGAASIANQAESPKKHLYHELTHTHQSVPIGVETLGIFGDGTMTFLKELGHLTKSSSADCQSFHYYFYAKESVLPSKDSMARLFCHAVMSRCIVFHI